MNKEVNENLKCTHCNKVQDHYCQIVYSQGDKVCTECKKITLAGDKQAFDNYINSRC